MIPIGTSVSTGPQAQPHEARIVYPIVFEFVYTLGVLHESLVHECLKSSLAFRKPATAVASRRPARADGLMVGRSMGMQASAA